MTDTDISSHLSQLLCLATGQFYDDKDACLRNFCALAGGQLLLDWLSSQISTDSTLESNGNAQHRDHDNKQSTSMVASLIDILLEEEETSLLNAIEPSPNGNTDRITVVPVNYMLPSRLKKHTGYICNETLNIQREATELRTKISETKDARQKCAQSIKLLRSTADSLASAVAGSDDGLSELSIGADATVTSTVNAAENLLCALEHTVPSTDHDTSAVAQRNEIGNNNQVASGQALLLKTQTHLSNITQDLQTYSKDYQQLRKDELQRLQDLDRETGRLSKALKSAHDSMPAKEILGSGQPQTLLRELIEMSDLLGSQLEGNDPILTDQFANLLSSIDEGNHTHSPGNVETSTEETITRAWKMDQVAILQCHEKKLNEALSSFSLALPPLERLHASLLGAMRCIQDAEATLETLGEELGEINVEHSTGGPNEAHPAMDDVLQRELKSVLIDCKLSVSPVLLLDKEDILVQLRLLKSRFDSSEISHKAWAQNALRDYSMRPLHPLLPDIYSQSPLNTSPPFEFFESARELETQTRIRTRQLQTHSKSLEEEVHETFAQDDHMKRLKGFVDRWSSSMAGVS